MSKIDVMKYYNEICNQREEMIKEIHDFEIEAEKGLIEPERLDEIKKTIQPLMDNYQTLSYIMFLLNKPERKKAIRRYRKKSDIKLKDIDKEFTKEGLKKQNKEVLKDLKKVIKGGDDDTK